LDAGRNPNQHLTNNSLTPAVPRVTALSAELTTTTTALQDYGEAQSTNRSGFRGAVQNRKLLRDDTLEAMRELNKIARALPKVAFPQAREFFRMPRSQSYANVSAGARSFATHADEMEAAFIERGRPATFVADLRAQATALDAVRNAREGGRTGWVGATAGIEEATREGIAILRELDAIITPLIEDDVELLAKWKAAVHIEADPVSASEEEPPTGSGTVAVAASPATAGEGGIVA